MSIDKVKAPREILIGARAALQMTQQDLARASGLYVRTISRFEGGATWSDDTRDAIQAALEARGIVFTNGDRPGFYIDRTKAIIPR